MWTPFAQQAAQTNHSQIHLKQILSVMETPNEVSTPRRKVSDSPDAIGQVAQTREGKTRSWPTGAHSPPS